MSPCVRHQHFPVAQSEDKEQWQDFVLIPQSSCADTSSSRLECQQQSTCANFTSQGARSSHAPSVGMTAALRKTNSQGGEPAPPSAEEKVTLFRN